jgi:hypothetical protein
MKWEVKNTKGGSTKLNLGRTWVDFSGDAIEGGQIRVNNPTISSRDVAEGKDFIWIGGGESVFISATATVNKCEPSFDAKFRIQEDISEATCVKRFVTKDLILRRCPLQVSNVTTMS